jgi:hypothetical protein
MDGEVINVRTTNPTIEEVNRHLLSKLDELIESINGKDPEMVRAITESVAKLNSSLKGNNIFTPQETPEERKEREAQEAIMGAMAQ